MMGLHMVAGSHKGKWELKYDMFILEANLYLSFLAVG